MKIIVKFSFSFEHIFNQSLIKIKLVIQHLDTKRSRNVGSSEANLLRLIVLEDLNKRTEISYFLFL